MENQKGGIERWANGNFLEVVPKKGKWDFVNRDSPSSCRCEETRWKGKKYVGGGEK